MKVERYMKGEEERVKIAGKLSEFEETGLEPSNRYEKQGTGILWKPDEEQVGIAEEFIAKVEAERESLNARGFTIQEDERMDFLLSWLESMTNKRINPSHIRRFGQLDHEESVLFFRLMLADGWVDGNGRMTDHGIKELAECIAWRDMMANQT